MMSLITIKDETASGDVLNKIQLQIDNERITVRDLIASRVTAEVELYNQKLPDVFNGLIKPTEAEPTISGFKMKKKNPIDAEKQVYIALEAFQRNGFFILVDNSQCEELDQEVLVNANSSISFIKLTPLAGG